MEIFAMWDRTQRAADEQRPSSRKSQEMHYDNVYKATVCVMYICCRMRVL